METVEPTAYTSCASCGKLSRSRSTSGWGMVDDIGRCCPWCVALHTAEWRSEPLDDAGGFKGGCHLCGEHGDYPKGAQIVHAKYCRAGAWRR